MFFVVSGLVMIILGDGSELASVQELDFESSKARCAAIRIIAISRCAEILFATEIHATFPRRLRTVLVCH